jgi:hypothetical protein
MTREIGGRLLDFWKNADPDYVNLQDLRKLLGTKSPASLPAGTVSGMVAAQS